MDADTRLAELEAEVSRLVAERGQWRTRYYEESRTYWDAELPPGGECCAVCGQPVESEPCEEHHPRTVADRVTKENARLLTRVAELESALGERTRQLNGLLDALSFDEKAVPA